MASLRPRLMGLLVAAVEQALPRFDDRTGRFLTLPEGPVAPGAAAEDLYWCPINQDILYALATVYHEPQSSYYGDPSLLGLACRAGDAIRAAQYPDGQVEFVKSDGSRWGRTYMGWTNYAWLETYALLGSELGEERRRQWAEGLLLAHEGQARELEGAAVHNIPAWKAMGLCRAARVLDRPQWEEVGRRMLAQVVAAQQPGGYWAEHGGPSTLYNLVYVHALGLYYRFTGDASVLEALEAATTFHDTFTYPDGSLVETIDGRVKYHPGVSLFGWPGFALFPRGRAYVRRLVEACQPERDLLSAQGGLLPSAYHHLGEGTEETVAAPVEPLQGAYQDWAVLCRHDPWFACLSGFVAPAAASRWAQDRQNLLSVWHQRCGLLVGGGNSKDQPQWSSFVADGRYLPDQARLLPEESAIAYAYGKVYCLLKCSLTADGVTITAEAEKGPALHQLVMPFKAGQRLRCAGGRELVAAEMPMSWDTRDLGEWVQLGECRVGLPRGARLQWPSRPFNPYAADGASAVGTEAAVLSVRLDGPPAQWHLSVVD